MTSWLVARVLVVEFLLCKLSLGDRGMGLLGREWRTAGTADGPEPVSATALSSDRASITFDPSSVGPGGIETCSPYGMELQVS
eukprot:SAG31_NODE_10852_length_1090_cov_1.032291_1_plen_82_part_10